MESRKISPESAADMQQSAYRMIDVGGKNETRRRAVAQGRIRMAPETLIRVRERTVPKGDVLAIGEVAGIMAAKRTADILPLCHPLGLDAVRVSCTVDESDSSVLVVCEASTTAKTGVEMEALLGVNAALLCIYDLVKAIDPVLQIDSVFLRTKEGGKSGNWVSPLYSEGKAPSSAVESGDKVLTGVRAAVVTVSDRCATGKAEDRSGPALERSLKEHGVEAVERALVADDTDQINQVVRRLCANLEGGLLVLTGGTGLGPRDMTPESLVGLWTKPIPGIGELLRSSGSRHNPMAWLSRSQGGFIGKTLVICLPGSSKAVAEGMDAVRELIPHLLHIAQGGAH